MITWYLIWVMTLHQMDIQPTIQNQISNTTNGIISTIITLELLLNNLRYMSTGSSGTPIPTIQQLHLRVKSTLVKKNIQGISKN